MELLGVIIGIALISLFISLFAEDEEKDDLLK